MTNGDTETMWKAPIEPTKSVPADIPSADPVAMQHECSQVVEGHTVHMLQSATISVLATDLDMRDSAALVVRADEARVQDSVTFLLVAGEVKGNLTTIFTPVTAAIIGASLMIGMWFLRPRR